MSVKIGDLVETGIDAGMLKGFVGKVMGPGAEAGSIRLEVKLSAAEQGALENLVSLNPSISMTTIGITFDIAESLVHGYVERTSNFGQLF